VLALALTLPIMAVACQAAGSEPEQTAIPTTDRLEAYCDYLIRYAESLDASRLSPGELPPRDPSFPFRDSLDAAIDEMWSNVEVVPKPPGYEGPPGPDVGTGNIAIPFAIDFCLAHIGE
jgi:hypothetical protein